MEVYTSKNIDDLPGVIDPRYVTHEENKYTMYAFDDTEELLDFERFEILQVQIQRWSRSMGKDSSVLKIELKYVYFMTINISFSYVRLICFIFHFSKLPLSRLFLFIQN